MMGRTQWQLLLLAACCALAVGGPAPAAQLTTRASVTVNGTEANGDSQWSAVSGDGRIVVFDSTASNLVLGDTNGFADVFLRDRLTGETQRMSVASDGTQANGDSGSPAVSGNGQYVAFISDATNLVSGDTNGYRDVFVHDRNSGTTERVSLATDGSQGNEYSGWPVAISWDGRYVAFVSLASNLVGGDTNGAEDIFVHDRQTGQTTRVSVASDGSQANSSSYSPSITPEGRYVAFQSWASNLVAGDTNACSDIFVRDRQAGVTERVSVASDGTQGNDNCPGDQWPYMWPALSANGRYVAFTSYSSNLVADDTNGFWDVFLHDRLTGETTRVSVASDGTQAAHGGARPALSADGRFVAFESWSTDLVPGDTNGYLDVFVHNCQSGETTRASVADDGAQGDSMSGYPIALTTDGRYVGFASSATNLVPDDTNGAYDSLLRDLVGASETGFYGSFNTRGKLPLQVTFTDLGDYVPSGTVATAWAWDFGDGGTSTLQNPIHTYMATGVFTVTLTTTCEAAGGGGGGGRGGGGAGAGSPIITTKSDYITVSFDDLAVVPMDPTDFWALGQILGCVQAGVVGGYPNGTYKPALTVDRATMAVFVARALAGGDALVPTGPSVATFSDVPVSHWAFKYVESAVDQGVVGGYPNGTYRPTVTVDRATMAVFIARAMVGGEVNVPSGPATAYFPDVATDFWAFKYVEYIRGEGVTGGYPDGHYHPEYAVTRDQMAVFVQRAFRLPM